MSKIHALEPKLHPNRGAVVKFVEELLEELKKEDVKGIFIILCHADGDWSERYAGETKMSEMLGFLERAKYTMLKMLDDKY